MTITYEGDEFVGLVDRGGNAISDLTVKKCTFNRCMLSRTQDVRHRTRVERVKLSQVKALNCSVGCPEVIACEITDLATNRPLMLRGAVFRRVTLRGRIGAFFAGSTVDPGNPTSPLQRLVDQHNAAFYKSVEWALDIREADFDQCDLRGVPGDLILRDPAKHFLLRRSTLLSGAWQQHVGKGVAAVIRMFLDSGSLAEVIVPDRRMMPDMLRLRGAGIAE